MDGREVLFSGDEMDAILLWTGAGPAMAYGLLTAFAGASQIRTKKIHPWAAFGMLMMGMLVAACGLFALLNRHEALIGLGIGLVGVQLLAINNGLTMFGRVNPTHHLIRFALSLMLFILIYLGLK
jgi:hypothetical protein